MDLESYIEEAVSKHDLPKAAARRMKIFLLDGCSPLPVNIDEALSRILSAAANLRSSDDNEARRLKRYDDVIRSVNSLKNLVEAMRLMAIGPIVGSSDISNPTGTHRPLYISLDLGLRQRRKHYHGHVLFQAIVLPDSFVRGLSANSDGKTGGGGVKIAEGGRYDELVCQYSCPCFGFFDRMLLTICYFARFPPHRFADTGLLVTLALPYLIITPRRISQRYVF